MFGNSEAFMRITQVDQTEYIPCAASFAYWPQTKADWERGIAWPIYICVSCLQRWDGWDTCLQAFPRALRR